MNLTKRSYKNYILAKEQNTDLWLICRKEDNGSVVPVRTFDYPVQEDEDGLLDTWTAFVHEVNIIIDIEADRL